MTASTVTHPLPVGTEARITGDPGPGWDGRKGMVFVVSDYVSAEECETDDGDPVAFYWGDNRGGMNNVTVPASMVEPLRTADQMQARSIPDPMKIVQFVQSECMTDRESIGDVDETSTGRHAAGEPFVVPGTEGMPYVTLSGRAPNGLIWYAELTLTCYHQGDE